MDLIINEDTERIEGMLDALKYLNTHCVDVGLVHAGGRLAFILGIQEHGSPIMRIPPRPVVDPGLHCAETQSAMSDAALKALESAVEGDAAAAEEGLEAVGQAGADGIRAYIDAGIPPGNSPVTVSGGWIYNRVARKGVCVPGKGGGVPLVRTGDLRDAFDYEVKGR